MEPSAHPFALQSLSKPISVIFSACERPFDIWQNAQENPFPAEVIDTSFSNSHIQLPALAGKDDAQLLLMGFFAGPTGPFLHTQTSHSAVYIR